MTVSGAGGPDGPADTTNAGTPGPGGSLSGELEKSYAIKRIQKKREAENHQNTSAPGKLTLQPATTKMARY